MDICLCITDTLCLHLKHYINYTSTQHTSTLHTTYNMTSTLQVNYTSIKFKINKIYIFFKIANHMCTLEKSLWLYIGKHLRGKSGDKETGGWYNNP